jgi:hypothetical protein
MNWSHDSNIFGIGDPFIGVLGHLASTKLKAAQAMKLRRVSNGSVTLSLAKSEESYVES